jgi:hypothetical protein
MTGMVAVLGGALGVALSLGAVLLRWSGHSARERARLAAWTESGRYWGVRVVSRPRSRCAAIDALERRIFPMSSAPRLPLTGCAKRWCRCSYRPYPERRRAERRAGADRRQAVRLEVGLERRTGRDRRGGYGIWKGESAER